MKSKRKIEDITDEMRPNKKLSSKMESLLAKEKMLVRNRIVERGIIHFRADKDFMTALLDVADQLKVAPGTLCRRLVWDQLKVLRFSANARDETSFFTIANELRSEQTEIKKELRKIREFLDDTQHH